MILAYFWLFFLFKFTLLSDFFVFSFDAMMNRPMVLHDNTDMTHSNLYILSS